MTAKVNKQGLTLVEGGKFIATATKLGLKVTKQAGNFRIENEADSSKRMYVPTTKKVHRVDLSGFSSPLAVEIPEDDRPTGRVTHWLDFTVSEKEILRAFYKIAKEHLATVAKVEAPAEQTEQSTEEKVEEPVIEAAASEAV